MVGQIKEIVEELAGVCRKEKIAELTLGRIVIHTDNGVSELNGVTLKMHELALKAPATVQSNTPTPANSNQAATPQATEDKLRFGSGSR